MEFHVTNSNNISGNGMVMHIKVIVTLVPEIQKCLPFDCLNFNDFLHNSAGDINFCRICLFLLRVAPFMEGFTLQGYIHFLSKVVLLVQKANHR